MSEAILITLDVALSALLKREKRGCLNVSVSVSTISHALLNPKRQCRV